MALAFVGMLVLRLFGIGLLIGYGRVEEPPLLFTRSQPHIRSFWVREILYYISTSTEPTISLTYSGGV